MFKESLSVPFHECSLIRQALSTGGKGLRLDGRTSLDYRDVRIEITRHENTAIASIQCGSTYVVCGLHGEVVTPSKDRPNEGIISFACDMSFKGEQTGDVNATSDTDICRMLERSIKESDAIDLESLCVSVGEQVWQLKCSINVIDCSGGNLVDMCCLAAMATLRAFRKAEVSFTTKTNIVPSVAASISSVKGSSTSSSAVKLQELHVYSADEREPLPLALHHTPLTITFALFADIVKDGSGSSGGSTATTSTTILVADPTAAEAQVMNGSISYSINAHRELCGINKPGHCPISQELILKGAQLATARALQLHQLLSSALQDLESADIQAKRARLEMLRQSAVARHGRETNATSSHIHDNDVDIVGNTVNSNVVRTTNTTNGGTGVGAGVILVPVKQNDPILAWGNLHQSVNSVSINDTKG